jgi:hypothetical protein
VAEAWLTNLTAEALYRLGHLPGRSFGAPGNDGASSAPAVTPACGLARGNLQMSRHLNLRRRWRRLRGSARAERGIWPVVRVGDRLAAVAAGAPAGGAQVRDESAHRSGGELAARSVCQRPSPRALGTRGGREVALFGAAYVLYDAGRRLAGKLRLRRPQPRIPQLVVQPAGGC